jgi:tetratricopeptide (TPR) repeat protein
MKLVVILLFMISCSTKKEIGQNNLNKSLAPDAFKKEAPLSNSSIQDFYTQSFQSKNPALLDETLDRFNQSELSNIKSSSDPLLEISLKCQKNDFESAFKTVSDNFNRYHKTASFWNQVANCHLLRGSFRKALLFYNKALEVSPNYVPALNNIGVMYSKQGQDQKALVAFERAYKQSKFSKTPRYNLARLYLSYGLTEVSIPIFQGLLNNSPQDIDLLNSLATAFLIQSDFDKSLSYYKRIPQKEWKNPEIGLNLSLLLKKTGKINEAKKLFNTLSSPREEKLRKYFEIVKSQIGET